MKSIVKVLIWIGAFIVSVIAEMIADGIFQAVFPGYRMGWILRLAFFALMFFVGKSLCDKWDVQAFEKEASKHGMTPGEYASNTFPPSLLDLCQSYKNDHASFENLMKQSIEAETITKSDANVLRYMFLNRK